MSVLTQVLSPPGDDEYYRPSPAMQYLHDTWRPSSASDSLILDLTGQVTLQDRFAAAHGGFADVYIGFLDREQSSPVKVSFALTSTSSKNRYGLTAYLQVAVKVLRSLSEDEDDRKKRNKVRPFS